MWARTAATTRGSVLMASTRSGAPQRGQRLTSMSNTRRKRCARASSGREWAPPLARRHRSVSERIRALSAITDYRHATDKAEPGEHFVALSTLGPLR